MAQNTFTLGSDTKYEASERARYNGTDGIIWIKRIKCADGSGWCHDGKAHMKLTATRRDVVEHFGQVYRPELINA